MSAQIVILAAGMGSRLGRSLPKPLTELSDGRTIMQQQFDNIHDTPSARARASPSWSATSSSTSSRRSPRPRSSTTSSYDQTNTSKSLLRALQASTAGGVLWMNGDVVFDPEALDACRSLHGARPVLRHA